MTIDSNIDRLKLLRTEDFPVGSEIVFCPTCDFQYEPGLFGKSECPTCRSYLHIVTVTEELKLLSGTK